MKNIFIAAAGLLFTNLCYAQDLEVSDVPSVVINKFNNAFPKASDIEWEKKGELYNAEFDLNWRDHEVWLNAAGAIIKHKKEIKADELPLAVTNKIKQDYSGYRIDDADQYEINKQFFYKVELKTTGIERKIVYTQQGKMIPDQL